MSSPVSDLATIDALTIGIGDGENLWPARRRPRYALYRQHPAAGRRLDPVMNRLSNSVVPNELPVTPNRLYRATARRLRRVVLPVQKRPSSGRGKPGTVGR